jgi:hypothetical protein
MSHDTGLKATHLIIHMSYHCHVYALCLRPAPEHLY